MVRRLEDLTRLAEEVSGRMEEGSAEAAAVVTQIGRAHGAVSTMKALADAETDVGAAGALFMELASMWRAGELSGERKHRTLLGAVSQKRSLCDMVEEDLEDSEQRVSEDGELAKYGLDLQEEECEDDIINGHDGKSQWEQGQWEQQWLRYEGWVNYTYVDWVDRQKIARIIRLRAFQCPLQRPSASSCDTWTPNAAIHHLSKADL